MKCIDETGKSLKQQLESVTVPADETEVERVLDSFQTRLLSTKPSSDCDDDDDDDESLSSVDDINEEIEFDDNEIVGNMMHSIGTLVGIVDGDNDDGNENGLEEMEEEEEEEKEDLDAFD